MNFSINEKIKNIILYNVYIIYTTLYLEINRLKTIIYSEGEERCFPARFLVMEN